MLPPKKMKGHHMEEYSGEKFSIESPVVSTKANSNILPNLEKQPKVPIDNDVANDIPSVC